MGMCQCIVNKNDVNNDKDNAQQQDLLDEQEQPENLNLQYKLSEDETTLDKYENTARRLDVQNSNIKDVLKVKMNDFNIIKCIGKGSFGKVLLVEKKDSKKIYAMKILKKEVFINHQNQIHHLIEERKILQNIDHPFLVGLHYAFQTDEKLALVLEFFNGGELYYHLINSGPFIEKKAKFYTAEIVLALEYLHLQGIIYRDLKAENILLDSNGHIRLTDFGLSKDVGNIQRSYTMCGTPEYIAPEMLKNKGHDKSVDWWSLGILLYEMMTGKTPFVGKDQQSCFKNIAEKELELKPYFTDQAKSFISSLLQRNPSNRLGYGPEDALAIKQHGFFSDINWQQLYEKKLTPPFKPNVKDEYDLRYIDQRYLKEDPTKESIKKNKTIKQLEFDGFTYNQSLKMKIESPLKKHDHNFNEDDTN